MHRSDVDELHPMHQSGIAVVAAGEDQVRIVAMPAPHLDYESLRSEAEYPGVYADVPAGRWVMAGFWGLLTLLTMFGLFAGALAGFVAPDSEGPAFALAITAAFFIAGLLGYLVFWTVVHEREEMN